MVADRTKQSSTYEGKHNSCYKSFILSHTGKTDKPKEPEAFFHELTSAICTPNTVGVNGSAGLHKTRSVLSFIIHQAVHSTSLDLQKLF